MATFFFILFHFIAVIFGFWMLLISIPLHIFYSMNKSNANKLSENIKEQTEVLKTQQEEVKNKNDSTKTETSMADELAKLAQLKESGILSEEEFLSQKEKLLNQ
jgi:predicted membrane protein